MAQVRVRKRGKTYSYIFEASKIDGKRKVVEKGGYATKGEAYNAGVEAYNDFRHGNIGITSEAITLKDFMRTWLEKVVALNVKPTSLQTYRAHYKNQIISYLGRIKLKEITSAMLDDWLRKLMWTGLARNTLRNVYNLIHYALDYAVYPLQLISVNPAEYIKVPKNAPRNVVKRTIITPEKFNALLEKYSFGKTPYIPLLLLYHTGMRLGEVLGLTWDDIDFEAKKINVRRQMIQLNGKGYFLTTLKNESSYRYVIIDNYLLGELRRWRNQQAENEKLFGDSYVYIYQDDSGHIHQQSKSLPLFWKIEKFRLSVHLVTGEWHCAEFFLDC